MVFAFKLRTKRVNLLPIPSTPDVQFLMLIYRGLCEIKLLKFSF